MLQDGPWSIAGEPGAWYLTDPSGLAAHPDELGPHVVTPPAGSGLPVLAGNEGASVYLRFDDASQAQALFNALYPIPPEPPRALPTSIPMYRIRIMLKLLGEWDFALAFINTLPPIDKMVALELLDHGDDLIVGGAFATGFKAYRGFSASEWRTKLFQAVDLVL